MRPSSSTWRSSVALLLLLALARPVGAWGGLCLPPVFDGGRRLHQMPAPQVYWLELLLRQHELCWRAPARPDEVRVVLAGNSAIFGFPLPVEQTFGALLNDDFASRGVPAHVFNLGFVNTYQLKDAVILHEALRYRPDLIVYPVTLAEFVHAAPIVWPPLIQFFASNADAVTAVLADPRPGLEAPFESYRPVTERQRPEETRYARLREAGTFVRLAVARNAAWLGGRLGAQIPEKPIATFGRQSSYDCALTQSDFAKQYADWPTWNILAYLEWMQKARGVRVLVVNWPVAHEPVGACYDVRYPDDELARYVDWLRGEAARRGLAFVDLHDVLPADEFLDSLHVSAAGHREVAARLEGVLTPLVTELAARRASRR